MPPILLRHPWNLTPTEAIRLQRELQPQVVIEPLTAPVRLVAGTDLSYDKHSDIFHAGIVVLDFDTLKVVAHSTVTSRAPFPYIPGLLSFRELPSLITAWEQLPLDPDLVLCDGQGIAHPRRLGIASHFGLVTGKPAIGCAKTLLTGKYTEPPLERGRRVPLIDRGEIVGYVLCTKDRVKPVFVSPGHRVGLEQSADLALACARGYKLPEPTRQAHLLVNRLRQGEVAEGVWMG